MTSVQEDLEKDLKKMYYDSDEYKNLWKTFRAFKLALLGHLHVSLGAEEEK